MKLLKPVAALVILAIASVTATIYFNGAPIMANPGPWPRLVSYLTENRITTTDLSAYPERETTTYHRPPDTVLQAAQAVARARGWEIQRLSSDEHVLEAVAATPIWGFKDDVTVRVSPTENGASALHITSASRLGSGDLGANTGRLIDLRRAIEDRL